jgi:hypothetical protein
LPRYKTNRRRHPKCHSRQPDQFLSMSPSAEIVARQLILLPRNVPLKRAPIFRCLDRPCLVSPCRSHHCRSLQEATAPSEPMRWCQPRTFSPGERVFKPAATTRHIYLRALALVATFVAVCDFFRTLFSPCHCVSRTNCSSARDPDVKSEPWAGFPSVFHH